MAACPPGMREPDADDRPAFAKKAATKRFGSKPGRKGGKAAPVQKAMMQGSRGSFAGGRR